MKEKSLFLFENCILHVVFKLILNRVGGKTLELSSIWNFQIYLRRKLQLKIFNYMNDDFCSNPQEQSDKYDGADL